MLYFQNDLGQIEPMFVYVKGSWEIYISWSLQLSCWVENVSEYFILKHDNGCKTACSRFEKKKNAFR